MMTSLAVIALSAMRRFEIDGSGYVDVPDGPGLGLTLNEAAAARMPGAAVRLAQASLARSSTPATG